LGREKNVDENMTKGFMREIKNGVQEKNHGSRSEVRLEKVLPARPVSKGRLERRQGTYCKRWRRNGAIKVWGGSDHEPEASNREVLS